MCLQQTSHCMSIHLQSDWYSKQSRKRSITQKKLYFKWLSSFPLSIFFLTTEIEHFCSLGGIEMKLPLFVDIKKRVTMLGLKSGRLSLSLSLSHPLSTGLQPNGWTLWASGCSISCWKDKCISKRWSGKPHFLLGFYHNLKFSFTGNKLDIHC